MRSTNDNPIDPIGTLGEPIRPTPPKPADTTRPFETVPHEIANVDAAIESIADTLRKKCTAGKAEEWEGLVLDDYTLTILSCI
jgi:hypothetical protein